MTQQQITTEAEAQLSGWIRTSRFSKNVTFIEIYDGTGKAGQSDTIQVVISPAVSPEMKQRLGVGTAIKVSGKFVESRGSGQDIELQSAEEKIEIVGDSDPSEFPVQKKDASMEYYRTMPHMRVRTAEFQRIFRARSFISMVIHQFFADNGFIWVHTPIITGSDCEGAGEMFHVSTVDDGGDGSLMSMAEMMSYPRLDDKQFFGKPANLTVSGQLEVEPFACAFSKVYTFGPTFRAEDSNTARHASEFWMIEPEIAFATVKDVMDLAEDMVKSIVSLACAGGFACDAMTSLDLNVPFTRITYTEAQEILVASGVEFEYPVGWGEHLQTEHERYLAETHFGQALFVTDYPIEQKSFYMRLNDDDKTVACFDLLVPGVGEIIGGSAREERLDELLEQMKRFEIDPEAYQWYLDIRKFGTVPHGGYGLGLERILMWVLGVANIRDVIPYPRTPGNMV